MITEKYIIKNNKIFANKLNRKGKFIIPCIVLGVNEGNEYKINFLSIFKIIKKQRIFNRLSFNS